MQNNKRSLGQMNDASWQEQARLIREMQGTKDLGTLYKLQGQITTNEADRQRSLLQEAMAARIKRQALGIPPDELAPSLSTTVKGPYDYNPIPGMGSLGPDTSALTNQAQNTPDPALSVPDPFVSQAQLASTGIFDGNDSPYGNPLKLDATNPDHMSAAKAALKEAIDSGKPVDQASLMSSIQSKIQEAAITRLTSKAKISELETGIIENAAKTNKALGKEGLNGPVTQKTKSAIEATIMKTHQARVQFSVLQKQFQPEFFSRLNKFGVGTLKELEKVDPDSLNLVQKKALGDYTSYKGAVGRAFDLYRKNITGAAAANQELSRLEENFLNMNMSATQFQTAVLGLDAFAQLDAISVRDLQDTNMDMDKLNELAVVNPRVEDLLKKWKAATDLVYDTEANNEIISDPAELENARAVLQRRLQQSGQ